MLQVVMHFKIETRNHTTEKVSWERMHRSYDVLIMNKRIRVSFTMSVIYELGFER